MTMYPQEIGSIPEETRRIAWAACPKGTLAMRLRDVLGDLYQDEQFVKLYPVEGQPGDAPWRLKGHLRHWLFVTLRARRRMSQIALAERSAGGAN